MERSWPSTPMRARSPAPAARASAPPYRTSPDDGSSSVAAIERSVDFPAPFEPSSATTSPHSHCSDTLLRTRRRPKWRDTSVKVSERKSIRQALRGRLAVELGVDPLERCHELPPPGGVTLGVDRYDRDAAARRPPDRRKDARAAHRGACAAPALRASAASIARSPTRRRRESRPPARARDSSATSRDGAGR